MPAANFVLAENFLPAANFVPAAIFLQAEIFVPAANFVLTWPFFFCCKIAANFTVFRCSKIAANLTVFCCNKIAANFTVFYCCCLLDRFLLQQNCCQLYRFSLQQYRCLLYRRSYNIKPQLHCHDFGPRQSYDSPRFVKSGCIGMILSSAVAPSWCTGVNRSSTVVILEESWCMIREPRGQRYDEFKPFKLIGVNRVGLWAWPKS